MSGAVLTLTVDDAAIDGALADFRELGADPRPLLLDIGAALEANAAERFELGVSPDGVPWRPSHRAKTEGGKTLVDSRQLLTSLTHNLVGDDAVEVGSNKIYAAIHQRGGQIRAKDGGFLRFTIGQREVFAREVTMPARPYLGMGEGDRADVLAIVADHVGRIASYWGA